MSSWTRRSWRDMLHPKSVSYEAITKGYMKYELAEVLFHIPSQSNVRRHKGFTNWVRVRRLIHSIVGDRNSYDLEVQLEHYPPDMAPGNYKKRLSASSMRGKRI